MDDTSVLWGGQDNVGRLEECSLLCKVSLFCSRFEEFGLFSKEDHLEFTGSMKKKSFLRGKLVEERSWLMTNFKKGGGCWLLDASCTK